jgi:Phage integrase family
MRSNSSADQIRIYNHCPQKPMGSWKRAWTTARRLARVRIRFHDLRHTTVRRLLDAGCTLEQIAPILGWSARTMEEMRKRYQHRSLENRRKTMLTLVTPAGSVDEVGALVTLLRGNMTDITVISAIADVINKRLKMLQSSQTSKS